MQIYSDSQILDGFRPCRGEVVSNHDVLRNATRGSLETVSCPVCGYEFELVKGVRQMGPEKEKGEVGNSMTRLLSERQLKKGRKYKIKVLGHEYEMYFDGFGLRKHDGLIRSINPDKNGNFSKLEVWYSSF